MLLQENEWMDSSHEKTMPKFGFPEGNKRGERLAPSRGLELKTRKTINEWISCVSVKRKAKSRFVNRTRGRKVPSEAHNRGRNSKKKKKKKTSPPELHCLRIAFMQLWCSHFSTLTTLAIWWSLCASGSFLSFDPPWRNHWKPNVVAVYHEVSSPYTAGMIQTPKAIYTTAARIAVTSNTEPIWKRLGIFTFP